MKLIILIFLGVQILFSNNIGTAENAHYIQFENNTGYYIEENLDIRKGDKVVIVNDNIYVIDRPIIQE